MYVQFTKAPVPTPAFNPIPLVFAPGQTSPTLLNPNLFEFPNKSKLNKPLKKGKVTFPSILSPAISSTLYHLLVTVAPVPTEVPRPPVTPFRPGLSYITKWIARFKRSTPTRKNKTSVPKFSKLCNLFIS